MTKAFISLHEPNINLHCNRLVATLLLVVVVLLLLLTLLPLLLVLLCPGALGGRPLRGV